MAKVYDIFTGKMLLETENLCDLTLVTEELLSSTGVISHYDTVLLKAACESAIVQFETLWGDEERLKYLEELVFRIQDRLEEATLASIESWNSPEVSLAVK